MKLALLKYDFIPSVNIGDYIQSLAAAQYFGGADWHQDDKGEALRLISRERLSDYEGEAVRMIMNGWYMHQPQHWPPSPQIDPLFVAFHISRGSEEGVLSPAGVSYLRRHEPIGCRDKDTMAMLLKRGIKAYYSSCLTLTLDLRYKTSQRTGEILFVDPCMDSKAQWYRKLEKRKLIKNARVECLNAMPIESTTKPECFYRLYGQIFPLSLLEKASYLRHSLPVSRFEDQHALFDYADGLLRRYASARFVVTSRIHCALPCLALNTPVIYVYDQHYDAIERGRVETLLKLFQVVNLRGNKFSSDDIDLQRLRASESFAFSLSNKQLHRPYADNLKEHVKEWISHEK